MKVSRWLGSMRALTDIFTLCEDCFAVGSAHVYQENVMEPLELDLRGI